MMGEDVQHNFLCLSLWRIILFHFTGISLFCFKVDNSVLSVSKTQFTALPCSGNHSCPYFCRNSPTALPFPINKHPTHSSLSFFTLNPLRKILQLRVFLLIRHASVIIGATVPEAIPHASPSSLQSSNHTSREIATIHPLNALSLALPHQPHVIRSRRCLKLHDHDSVRIGVENRNLLDLSELLTAAFHVFVQLGFEVRLYGLLHSNGANAWFQREKTCFEER